MIVLNDDGTVDYITTRYNEAGLNAEDYITCPGCRVAIPLGETCACPMKTKANDER